MPHSRAQTNNEEMLKRMVGDGDLRQQALDLLVKVSRYRYSYNFNWLGRPIIQFPEDVIACQEIVWRIKPDLIVETGVAHGGSLIFWASMLHLLSGNGQVVGIDVEIRKENRVEIEQHPLFDRITLVEGSSVAEPVLMQVRALAQGRERVMVVLDSNHTHVHVRQELELYAPLVRRGSYLIVFDTIVEQMPPNFYPDRPWGRGDNPKTALTDFLQGTDRFEVDTEIDAKLLLSDAPGGYLRCVKDPA